MFQISNIDYLKYSIFEQGVKLKLSECYILAKFLCINGMYQKAILTILLQIKNDNLHIYYQYEFIYMWLSYLKYPQVKFDEFIFSLKQPEK